MAEMFPTRMRYSGVSLGYQVTSIVAGSLAPIIAVKLLDIYDSSVPIAIYLAVACAITFVAVLVHPGDQGHRPRSRSTSPTPRTWRRASAGPRSDDATRPDAPPWSPAARAASARRARGSSPAAAPPSRSPTSTTSAAKALADEIGGNAWAVDLLDVDGAGGAAAGDRHPGQQRRHPDRRADRRLRPGTLPRDARADGRGAVPADPRGAAAHVRAAGSAASSTSRRCTACAPRSSRSPTSPPSTRSRGCRR